MTIYVFGDPELLREALYALASIFNLAEWSDPGNAMGLGGNMLAVALIGLVAVGIYGVTSQEVRVDYLLVAMIVFGLLFSAKIDVNVEDIQTGDAQVVADIPIGIAAVAAAASTAARDLTETTGTALQRVGSETSVLTQGGFLDPLRVLMSLRPVNVADIDRFLHKSVLEYYKDCVGRTRVVSPGTFDEDEYLRTDDPAGYLFDTTNIVNFVTVEYTLAQPGGVAIGCYGAAANLLGRLNGLADGSTPGVEAYLRRSLGAELYNSAFEFNDVDTSIDLLFRGALSSQEFMRSLFIRNMHNTAEAYAEAEYGTPTTQYVAIVTDAFESDRVESAAQGTVFLQYMFPLMTFFQFLFFAIAPFVALVILANPFAAGKTVGGYLLFGVWTYSWMPVAAIVNHFSEITLQNALEFAGTGLVGTGYTAILGFDDFYNLVGTKLAIGSKALQWTPVITAAVLGGSMFGLTKLGGGGGGSGGPASAKINTGAAAPSLMQNQPIVSAGGRFSSAYGGAMSPVGSSGAYTTAQDMAYGAFALEKSASQLRSATASRRVSAQNEVETQVRLANSTISGIAASSGESSTLTKTAQATLSNSVRDAVNSAHGSDIWSSFSSGERNNLMGEVGMPAVVAKVAESSVRSSGNDAAYKKAQSTIRQESGEIAAAVMDSVVAAGALNESQEAKWNQQATRLNTASEELEAATEASLAADQAYQSASSIKNLDNEKVVNLAQQYIQRYGARAEREFAMALTRATNDPSLAADIKDGGRRTFESERPVGIDMAFGSDGRGDGNMDLQDVMSGQISYASSLAAYDPRVAKGLTTALQEGIGLGTGPSGIEGYDMLADEARKQSPTFDSATDNMGGTFSQAKASGLSTDGDSGLDLQTVSQVRGEASATERATADRMNRINSQAEPTLKSRDQAAVDSLQASASAAVENDDSLRGLAPDLVGQAEQQSDLVGNVMRGSATEDTVSSKMVNMAAPDPGYNDQLFSSARQLGDMNGSLAQTNAAADDLVGMLQGAVLTQFPDDARRQESIDSIYQGYQSFTDENGEPLLSKQQAALLTFGEVGRRLPGASDLMVGGISAATFGLIGNKAGSKFAEKKGLDKAGARFARILGRATGTVGGVAIFAGGVWAARQEGKEQAQVAARSLATALISDFETARPDLADKLDRLVAKADNQEDVFDAFKLVLEEAGSGMSSGAEAMVDSKQGQQQGGGWIEISENN